MLEKLLGVKYWALIGSALLLTACANSNTGSVPATPDEPVTVEESQEPVAAEPTESVVEETMMEDPSTQESLNAASGGALVHFAYDRYDISSAGRSMLQAQATWLEAHGDARVTVEGHCDERGTREYNLALGDRRANSVKNYLVALGVDPARIHTVSYGKERPAVTGTGKSVWSKNRRGYTRVN